MAKLIVLGRKLMKAKGQEYLGLTEVSQNIAFLHHTMIVRWHSKLLYIYIYIYITESLTFY